MKITYSVATSRDGYIARKDGDVSWLEEQNIAPEDTGLAEFFSAVDGLIMGRKTYDFVFNYG
ncbi:MAG: dihydrofolate reductase, partial [Planctomycetota bacterium]